MCPLDFGHDFDLFLQKYLQASCVCHGCSDCFEQRLCNNEHRQGHSRYGLTGILAKNYKHWDIHNDIYAKNRSRSCLAIQIENTRNNCSFACVQTHGRHFITPSPPNHANPIPCMRTSKLQMQGSGPGQTFSLDPTVLHEHASGVSLRSATIFCNRIPSASNSPTLWGETTVFRDMPLVPSQTMRPKARPAEPPSWHRFGLPKHQVSTWCTGNSRTHMITNTWPNKKQRLNTTQNPQPRYRKHLNIDTQKWKHDSAITHQKCL